MNYTAGTGGSKMDTAIQLRAWETQIAILFIQRGSLSGNEMTTDQPKDSTT